MDILVRQHLIKIRSFLYLQSLSLVPSFSFVKLATWGTQDDEKHNTICVGHNHMQTNTNDANKTCSLLQTTGGNDELNIAFKRKWQRASQHVTQNVQTHNRTAQKTKTMSNTDPTHKIRSEIRCSRRIKSSCFL